MRAVRNRTNDSFVGSCSDGYLRVWNKMGELVYELKVHQDARKRLVDSSVSENGAATKCELVKASSLSYNKQDGILVGTDAE